MKKQSSIEWLSDELKKFNTHIPKLWLKQAKEMHKEEIIDACEEFGNLNGVDIEDYEQYYNETFNN
jgi:hypothetical protein